MLHHENIIHSCNKIENLEKIKIKQLGLGVDSGPPLPFFFCESSIVAAFIVRIMNCNLHSDLYWLWHLARVDVPIRDHAHGH